MYPGTFVPLNAPRHTGEGWRRSVLFPCRPHPPHSFPSLEAHILRSPSPSVHPRCHPHLKDTHLTLGPMGSVSTAQMRHKPAKETRGHLGSPLAGGVESCQYPTALRSPVEDWCTWKGGMAQWLAGQLGASEASEGIQLNTPKMIWPNSIISQHLPSRGRNVVGTQAPVEL